MAKKLGNDYRLWIEGSTPGTYAEIKGNTQLRISREAQLIDTSSKDNFPYGTQAPGLRNLTIDFELIPDLPDTTGYGVLETAANAATAAPKNFQIRKGGSAGAAGDVVFQASMYIGSFSTTMNRNEPVQATGQLTLATAPTTDALA